MRRLFSGLLVSAMVSVCAVASAQADAGWALLESGDLDAAEAAFVQAGGAAGTAGQAAVAAARARWPDAVRLARQATTADTTESAGWVVLCRGLTATGEFGAALAACDRAAALTPDVVHIWESACAASLAQYRYASAVNWCGGGLQYDDRSADLLWRLGIALNNLGRAGDAERTCRSAVAVAPEEPMTHFCLGSVQLERRDFAGALRTCDEATRLGPNNALAHYCRGMAQLGGGNIDGARATCETARRLAPNEALTWFCLGRVELQAQNYAAARERLEGALSRNDNLVEARGSIGDALTRSGDPAEGERWLRDATTAAPNGDRWAQLAQNLHQQERWPDAIEAWQESLRLRAAHAPTLVAYAQTLRSSGDLAGAYTQLQAAVTAAPDDPRFVVQLVDVALRENDLPRATEAVTAGLARHATDTSLHALHCSILTRTRAWAAAEETCSHAATLAGDVALPQQMLGVIYLETQRPQAAETVLRAVVASGVADGNTWLNLGNALLAQRRPADAVDAYQRATQASPQHAYGHYALGTALHDAGRAAPARTAFCRASELDNNSTRYRTACENGQP